MLKLKENELFSLIKSKAAKCTDTILHYAGFVSDLEFLAEQNPAVFDTTDKVSKFDSLWLELEIVNALALDELEQSKTDFTNKWDVKYKEEAEDVVNNMLCFLESVF